MNFLEGIAACVNSSEVNQQSAGEKGDCWELAEQLKEMNALPKKQRLNLMEQDPNFLRSSLRILRLDGQSEYIFQEPKAKGELVEEFKKLLLKVQFGCACQDQNLCEKENPLDEFVYIFMSGKIQVHSLYDGLLKKANIQSDGNTSNSPRKKTKGETHVTTIKVLQQEIPPLIDESFVTKIITLSTVEFIRIAKRGYQNLSYWLYHKYVELNTNFISRSLSLEADDIRSYRLHRKPFLQFAIGQEIDLAKKGYGLLILRRGEVKITYRTNLKHSKQQLTEQSELPAKENAQILLLSKQQRQATQVILTQGSIISCSIPQIDQFYTRQTIKVAKIIKEAAILNIDQGTLNQLFEYMPRFKDSLRHQLQSIQTKRINYAAKQNPPKLKSDYNQQLRKLQLKNVCFLAACKPLKNRFNSRVKNSNGQQVNGKFLSNYSYVKIIMSKQIISNSKAEKENLRRPSSQKATNYLKKSQAKKNEIGSKQLKLRLRSMAQKSLNFDHGTLEGFYKNNENVRKGLFEDSQSDTEWVQNQSNKKQKVSLAENDTGIIHQFVKGSHSYQKSLHQIIVNSVGNQVRMTTNKIKLKEELKRHNIRKSCDIETKNGRFNLVVKKLGSLTNYDISRALKGDQFLNTDGDCKKSPYVINGYNRYHNSQSLLMLRSISQLNSNCRKTQVRILHRLKSGKVRRLKRQHIRL